MINIVVSRFSFGVDTDGRPGIVSGHGSCVYYASGARAVGYNVETNEVRTVKTVLAIY